MEKLKKWLRAAADTFRIAGLGAGALALLFGLFQDMSGGATFWSLSGDDWFKTGLAMIAVLGAISIVRHDYLLHSVGELYGNEYARGLLADGIPPFRDQYLQYLRRGDYATVHRFWRAGIIDISDEGFRTDLHIACEAGHAAIVRGLIERGGDPKRPDNQGRTPLMIAAGRGKIKVIEVLAEHDCAMDATATSDGVSALYAAAANGHHASVELLLKLGAEIDRRDHDNMTPLMAALAQQKWDIARMLMDAGADIARKDASGATLLDYAVSRNAPSEITNSLLDRGVKYREPRIRSIGGGHSGTGKVRVTWEDGIPSEVEA